MASMLISPIYLAKFSNGETLGLVAFVAAIVGGFNQVRGAIAGGLLIGVVGQSRRRLRLDRLSPGRPADPAGADHPVPPAGPARPQRGARGMSARTTLLIGVVLLVLLALAPRRPCLDRPALSRPQALRHLHPDLVAGDGDRGHGRQPDRGLCRPGDAGAGGLRRHRRLPHGASRPRRACRSAWPSSRRASLTFVVGIVLGFPALRVQKHYLAFVTLAFSVLCWLVFRNEQWLTGGVMGIRDIERPSLFGLSLRNHVSFYWFVLAITAAADLRAVVDRALAVGTRLHGAARESAARRKPRRRCAALHPARLRARLGLWRHGGQPLCAAGRVHRPQRRSRSAPRCSSC